MALDPVQLRQDRQKVVVEYRSIVDAISANGVETPEQTEKLAKMEDDIRKLEKLIEREERAIAFEAESAKKIDAARHGDDPGKRWGNIHYPALGTRQPSRAEIETRASYAIQGWLRAGRADPKLEQDHFEAAKFFGFDLRQKEIEMPIIKNYRQFRREQRALNVATPTQGQETIPEGFVYALETALLQFGGVRAVADVIRTDSGNDLPWPTANDTNNSGDLLAEATTFGSSVDPGFGAVIFKAFKYSSKPVLISTELLQDSAFDLGARIGEMLGIRIGRIQNLHFTTGSGTTLPKGLTVAGTAGKVAASMTTFTADEIIDLEHSVDPAYRNGASWMMHDLILAHVRKLKFSIGSDAISYVWQPGLQAGSPDRILGYPYTINQQMSSTLALSEKVVLFGDMMKYKIRDVATIRLVRLDELYAATDQVAFVAYLRSDGNLLDAGTHPVKWLELAPS